MTGSKGAIIALLNDVWLRLGYVLWGSVMDWSFATRK